MSGYNASLLVSGMSSSSHPWLALPDEVIDTCTNLTWGNVHKCEEYEEVPIFHPCLDNGRPPHPMCLVGVVLVPGGCCTYKVWLARTHTLYGSCGAADIKRPADWKTLSLYLLRSGWQELLLWA
jgi:hypothetical protein